MISAEEKARLIRIQMAKREVNARQLCKKIGVSEQSFCGYMKGRTAMPLTVLSRVCSYLGMTQEERGAFLM